MSFRAVIRTALLAAIVTGTATASAQTFSRVTTELRLGQFDYVLAVADLNADGRTSRSRVRSGPT